MFRPFLIILLILAAQPSTVHTRTLRSTKFESHNHLQQNSDSIQKSNKTPQQGVSVASARRYLHKFGYLEEHNNNNYVGFIKTYITNRFMNNNVENEFDEGLEKAVKKFQEYYNLKVSGKLDSETMKLMLLPRCGVPDHNHNHGTNNNEKHNVGSKLFKVTSKYAFIEGIPQWPLSQRNLTYTFDDSGKEVLPQDIVRDAFKAAFEQWSSVSTFTFEEVPKETGDSDIVIGFYSGDHGDDSPFDKFGSILAHAFGPLDGRLHVNADEPWSTQVPIQKGFYDLVWVAIHEIGHTLGLEHSSHRDAIMYAFVDKGVNKRVLSIDDINGIEGLYSSPIRVDSHTVPERCDFYHLLIVAFLSSLVICMIF